MIETRARLLAEEWHKGQMYGDRTYMHHLSDVVTMCMEYNHWKWVDFLWDMKTNVYATAWLHDILEDTACTPTDIEKASGLLVMDAVICLTKEKGESYNDYLEKVMGNEIAWFVKKMDTLCNLKHSVFEGNKRRVAKYTKQLQLLSEVNV